MNANAIVDPTKISIISIRTLKGNIEFNNEKPDFKKSELYDFSFDTKTNVEKNQKLIQFVLEVKIVNVDDKDNLTGLSASYTNEFVFKIENLDEFIDFFEDDRLANINVNLGVTLASIAYSTMRGIIHIRTQGTILEGIIIPVIDPKKIIIPTTQEQVMV